MPYLARTGCPWRALPHDVTLTWTSTHKHILRWTRTGQWSRPLPTLREETRQRCGRRRKPTAAVIDSSSVQDTPVRGPRGFDGAKHIDGIKRHIAIDTTGLPLAAHVTSADVQDRATLPAPPRNTTRSCSAITKAWSDKGHTVAETAAQPGVTAEAVSDPKPTHGFVVQPRRWVSEPTNSWINRHRRLIRQYQTTTTTTHQGFPIPSQIGLPLRRLDRRQLLDTL